MTTSVGASRPVPLGRTPSPLVGALRALFARTGRPGRFPVVFSDLLFEGKGIAPHGVIKAGVSTDKTQFLSKPENEDFLDGSQQTLCRERRSDADSGRDLCNERLCEWGRGKLEAGWS